MIKILIKEKDNQIKSLIVKGHANSAPYGKDLVCAAVSAVTFGGLNNIQNPKDFKFEIKEGLVNVESIGEITEHDRIVLETIVCGLKTIQEENTDFVQIKKENF